MNLDLVSTSDLLDAVLARFDHAIFGGMSARTIDETEQAGLQVFVGDPWFCAGLCADVSRTVLADADAYEEDEEYEGGDA